MRTITIVYQRHPYLHIWLKPLFSARKEFKKLGYRIKYQSLQDYVPITYIPGFQKYGKKIEENSLRTAMHNKMDIVMMAFHHSTSDLCQMQSDKRIEIIKRIKSNCNLLIWLDTADSTGTSMFDVLPYVDLYFKKQLLKNREDYCRDVYGSRTFCEYYHNLLHVDDSTITKRIYPKASYQDIHKLRIAWNVGLGDLYATGIRRLLPFSVTKPRFRDVEAPRKLDLQYRGSGYSPIAGYPRSKSMELLMEMKGMLKMCDFTRRIPKHEFIKEGENSKAILSPFGWGEICGRDFEAIVYGACMIKQDMSHCDTYPNVYQPMVTYVPLRWDFSDFKEKVLNSGSPEYKQIAKNAQIFYKSFFSPSGRKDFASHIIKQIEQ